MGSLLRPQHAAQGGMADVTGAFVDTSGCHDACGTPLQDHRHTGVRQEEETPPTQGVTKLRVDGLQAPFPAQLGGQTSP